ncbi:MAG: carboxypeptidase regulatory-like domain-containing protein, partial [Terracidiphilus sp.]
MTNRTISSFAVAFLFFVFGVNAHAVSFTGAVTNRTTNRPSSGDTVVLIDVQAGMNEAASTTTNASGQYSIDAPGMGPYLIRVTHQGGSYFIAAPQGGTG